MHYQQQFLYKIIIITCVLGTKADDFIVILL